MENVNETSEIESIDEDDKEFLQKRNRGRGYEVVERFIESTIKSHEANPNLISPAMLDIIDTMNKVLQYEGPAYEQVYIALSKAIKLLVMINTNHLAELYKDKYDKVISASAINLALIAEMTLDDVSSGKVDFADFAIKFNENNLIDNIAKSAEIDSSKLKLMWQEYNETIDRAQEEFTIFSIKIRGLLGIIANDVKNLKSDDPIKQIFTKIVIEFWPNSLIPKKFNAIKLEKLTTQVVNGVLTSGGDYNDFCKQFNIPEKYIKMMEIDDDDLIDIESTIGESLDEDTKTAIKKVEK